MVVKLQRRGHWSGIAEPVVSAFTDVEGYVADAIDKLSRQSMPRWTFRSLSSGSVTANPWDFVVASGECTVVLPTPSVSNRCAEVVVIRATLSPVTIAPVSGLINGSATLVPTSYRARTVISSGEGWYSNA